MEGLLLMPGMEMLILIAVVIGAFVRMVHFFELSVLGNKPSVLKLVDIVEIVGVVQHRLLPVVQMVVKLTSSVSIEGELVSLEVEV